MYDVRNKIFNLISKDELGQLLDDEQQWAEGTGYTGKMDERLDYAVEQASAYADTFLRGSLDVPLSNPPTLFLDTVARLALAFILQRRNIESGEAIVLFDYCNRVLKEIRNAERQIGTSNEPFVPYVVTAPKDFPDELWRCYEL